MSESIEENEAWRPVEGWVNYEVSSLGRIRRLPSVVKSCYGKTVALPARVLKMSIAHDGYIRAHLSQCGVKATFPAHRLVAIAFIENPMNLPHVNHKDFNRQNNSVGNLEWCTPLENNLYTKNAGRAKYPCGSTNGSARKIYQFDAETGEFIREFETTTEAANAVGVGLSRVCNAAKVGWRSGGYRWSYSPRLLEVLEVGK